MRRFLVRWQGRTAADDSWISEDELRRLQPDLMQQMEHEDFNSPESSSSHPGRVDAGRPTSTSTRPTARGSLGSTRRHRQFQPCPEAPEDASEHATSSPREAPARQTLARRGSTPSTAFPEATLDDSLEAAPTPIRRVQPERRAAAKVKDPEFRYSG